MMDGHSQTSKHDRSSAKSRPKTLEAASFEVAEDHSAVLSDDIRRAKTKSNSKSSEIVSTTDIVSAVGQIWDCANRSLERLQPKRNGKPTYSGSQQDNIVCQVGERENSYQSTLAENECVLYNLKSLQQSSEHARVSEITPLESCSETFWRNKKDVYTLLKKPWKGNASAAAGVLHDFRLMYCWMGQVSFCTLRQCITAIHECEKDNECHMLIHGTRAASGSFRGYKSGLSYNLRNASSDLSSDTVNGLASGDNANIFRKEKMSIPSLYSDYFLQVVEEPQGEVGACVASCSGLCVDDFANSTTSHCAYDHNKESSDDVDELLNKKSNMIQNQKFNSEGDHQMEMPTAKISKHIFALAKQEHAFSGALAGTFVSLCLHPVDTIKTVIQSCRVDQKSLYFIGQSIISERGLTGLYRGIASNIATSAPISAIYTFSYETVKGLLLPFLPKEYHSVAHCTAGGCASIATSFIFTPSERIKQQMQVSPRYQNCWNAFLRIIENGGLSSLYTGWGAVLCRNIPHSIIKFYTYESLKQHILSSDQPNTCQTLLCGGLAGSTAAFFSTPFDVVKTRYQTQVPGSVKQYGGVFSAIQQIGKTEGVQGLYRGLTPRLVMYMSQGALFFASYEFFKGLFSLERPK